MTVKELKKRHDEKEAQRGQLTASIDTLTTRAQQCKEAAEEAAQAGDVPKYREQAAAAKEAEDVAYVMSAQLKKLDQLEKAEDIYEAWGNYCDTEGSRIKKEMAAYEKKVRELSNQFLRIMRDFDDMIFTRNALADYAGLQHGALDTSLIPIGYTADVDLYRKKDLINDDDVRKFRGIIMFHN